MKRTFKFFAAALAIVAAASCAKENAPVDNGNDEANLPLYETTFDASILQTKTTLEGLDVHWSQNDAIMVFKYKENTTNDNLSPYSGVTFSIDNESISEDFAQFTGSISESTSYAAIYPSGLVNKNGGYANRWQFVSNTLQNQKAVAGDFPTVGSYPAHISMAFDYNGTKTFEFANSLAYFKFRVDNADVYSIELSTDKVSSASGDGSNRALNSDAGLGGTLYYRPRTGKFDLQYNGSISLTTGGNALVANTDYFIALPPVDMEGLAVVGKDQSGNEIFRYEKSAFTAESNTIYNLGTLKQNVFAPKVYKVVSQVSKASDLVSGKLYVIQSYGAQSYFWTNVDSKLVLTGGFSTNSDFSAESVFEYTVSGTADITASDSYNYKSSGQWKSLANDKYVSYDFRIIATSSTGMQVVSANGWAGESGKDIDMYNRNTSNTIYYNSSYELLLGTISVSGGNSYRKWYIYEVQEQ